MFKGLKPIVYQGREVWPLIEGGKGVSATNHASAGAWAAAGGIGTVSAVNADSYDPTGKIVPAGLCLAHPRGAASGTDPIRRRRRGRTGQARARHRRRQGCDQHQRAVGNGRRADHSRPGAGTHQGAGRGRHLRRGHAVSPERDRLEARRVVPADHQFGPCVSRAVEAGLFQGGGPAVGSGVRRPLARRRA